jgi:hypothetical protein
VKYKYIRHLTQELSLHYIYLLIAFFTFEVANCFSLYVLLEALIDVLEVLDGYGEIIELLFLVPHILTLLTHQLRACLTTIHTIEEVLEWSRLDGSLQLIEDHVQEFLRILLNQYVDRLTREVLKCKTKLMWIVINAIT